MARILVIDDSPSILAGVDAILRSAGHDVTTLSSGRTVVRHLQDSPIDLVLTDVFMPPPDGFEVIAAIREAGLSVPIVAMSTNGATCSVFHAARMLGVRATLEKPFQPADLLRVIDATLRPPTPPAPSAATGRSSGRTPSKLQLNPP